MDIYMHARMRFTIILGLGVSRLLSGVARIVQHPKEYKGYWVHLLWSLFVFPYLIHFWWWEYRLQEIQQWTFALYFFISIYAVIQYLLCVLLFPEEMADYNSFKEYFYSRRQWIFSVVTILFVADLANTFIKDAAYVHSLGAFHYVRTILYILLSALAIKIRDEWFSRGLCNYCDSR
jgi:hypothetical protein